MLRWTDRRKKENQTNFGISDRRAAVRFDALTKELYKLAERAQTAIEMDIGRQENDNS